MHGGNLPVAHVSRGNMAKVLGKHGRRRGVKNPSRRRPTGRLVLRFDGIGSARASPTGAD